MEKGIICYGFITFVKWIVYSIGTCLVIVIIRISSSSSYLFISPRAGLHFRLFFSTHIQKNDYIQRRQWVVRVSKIELHVFLKQRYDFERKKAALVAASVAWQAGGVYQRLHGRPQPRRGCPPLLFPRPRSATYPRPLASPLPGLWPRPLGGVQDWWDWRLWPEL